jgi:hypothetical protein
MIGSIERLLELIPRHPVVPVMMLIVGVHGSPDPTRRVTGYGGVLTVPSAAEPSTANRIDPMLQQQRHDIRVGRGRVLYAPGHGPVATTAKPAHKEPCVVRRVVQGRAGSASPNS